MKKIILLLVAICLASMNSVRGEHKYLHAPIIDETPIYPGKPKAPVRPLTIDITGHTLTLFSAFEDVVMVELLDEDENVVYTDWLAPGQTSLVFPNTLTGEYTIRLTIGSLCYVGEIELRN